jgi:CheY-like chemotaxis protein
MSAMQSAFMLTTARDLNPLSSANRAMLLELMADATVDVDACADGAGTALMQACRSKNVDLARLDEPEPERDARGGLAVVDPRLVLLLEPAPISG